ncbi:hypothetical protein ACEPAG_439 [Sanghuangporus baumii]
MNQDASKAFLLSTISCGMSDASDDPALLFTPVQSASKVENPDDVPPSLSLDTPTRPGSPDVPKDASGTRIYVEVPKKSATELAKFQPAKDMIRDSDPDAEGTSKIEEIEGEYTLGSKRFLFARYGDGVIRRKEDWEFRTSHPELYDDYMKRREEGNVPKFDPSSVRVHPKHRIQLVLNVPKRKPGPVVDGDYVSDSDSSNETEGAESDDYEDTYLRRSTRASRRQTSKQVRVLPYSPRKTRSRGRQTSPISVDDDSESEQSLPRRRSSRNAKKKSNSINEQSDYQSDGVEESSDYQESRTRRRSKQPTKRKGPKPAYGRIRKVEDLYDSDPDTAPLRGHREECEKCHRAPSHILLKRLSKRTKRRKKHDDDLSEDEEELANRLGGWVRCLKCCVAAHWNCLSRIQQQEILKAARVEAEVGKVEGSGIATKMKDLNVTETTEFICGSCSKGGICMVCHKTAVESEQKASLPTSGSLPDAGKTTEDAIGKDDPAEPKSLLAELEPGHELLFRCNTCKRLAHYAHLPVEDEDLSPVEIARFYQKDNDWQCDDCASYIFRLDKIIAWRPFFPANASDKYMSSPEDANYKENLPREYLVKWVDRSYRRVEWVPHMWLVATHYAKLKNFYSSGPRLPLLNGAEVATSVPVVKENTNDLALANTEDEKSRATSADIEHTLAETDVPPPPMLDAESRIPPRWKIVDRVLDVLIWAPRKLKGRPPKKQKSKQRIDDHDSEAEASPEAREEFDRALDFGDQPSADVTETIEEFERRTGVELGEEHIGRVIWAFLKWDDLLYEEATWDSPPRPGSPGYTQFEHAFKYFLESRKVFVRKKTTSEIAKFEDRKNWSVAKLGVPEDGSYNIGQAEHFKLMPFQVEGVNWLCRNWFRHQQCILADEMGLGKTVQIITFLGLLHARMGAFPSLVIVPNSTITNWVREFARWAPELRVVPFYGEQKSREIIKQYELEHPVITSGTTGAKYHILVTTYEAVSKAKDFNAVFKKNPRWEVLVVDEGQRLKSDSSLLFRKLNELNSGHRIIMTGTPLNNNIRELFNLMNFLDPDKWNDLEALTKEFEELDEERVKELHERLRPYFLRRVKAEVLDLPAKNEVIVPVSMAPLQKEIYKSILSKNLAVLSSLRGIASTKLNKSAAKASNLKNMLMQLRKCLQHPYLVADDIEPKGLSPIEAHLKLIDASGKLRLLKMLLPKLKARGHRVLLFSQFVIGLNIIEDFLQGEGYRFLRLDGNTKQADRQKDMDEFNKEDSDIFIYILSTRAGGVGINLWSADTVIIFDPDFNPHQDLQAIARAHRYGQKKTCLVFKLMTKNSAEEKIIQTGKKKLVLDHLIVQKMDDDEDSSEVQTILMFGAKALFDDGEAEANKDIIYSENDVETLIKKIETEETKESAESSNNAFSFAKVWSAQKDDLDEFPDEVEDEAQGDSWAQTLQKIALERQGAEDREQTGRGARRKAALATKSYFEDLNEAASPDKLTGKGKKRQKSALSDSSDDEYNLPRIREASLSSSASAGATVSDDGLKRRKLDVDEKFPHIARTRPATASASDHARPLSPIMNRANVEWSSHNLAEYRQQLIYSEEESYGDRLQAVRAIDETLSQRGALHLIAGQPAKPRGKRPVDQPFNGVKSAGSSSSSHNRHSFNGHTSSKEGGGYKPVKSHETKLSENQPKPVIGTQKSSLTPFLALKRDASPAPGHPVKKTKVRACDICKGPYHLPVHCPTVTKGPSSILKAIVRLTNERGNPATLTALRSILRKQRKAVETSGHNLSQQSSSAP